jgi:hypothetical protein
VWRRSSYQAEALTACLLGHRSSVVRPRTNARDSPALVELRAERLRPDRGPAGPPRTKEG